MHNGSTLEISLWAVDQIVGDVHGKTQVCCEISKSSPRLRRQEPCHVLASKRRHVASVIDVFFCFILCALWHPSPCETSSCLLYVTLPGLPYLLPSPLLL